MARTRLELSQILHRICENCYYTPPSSGIVYPCIIYELDNTSVHYADNKKYLYDRIYTVTLIDENPDSEYFEKIHDLPFVSFDRLYIADNLNHFVFTLYW